MPISTVQGFLLHIALTFPWKLLLYFYLRKATVLHHSKQKTYTAQYNKKNTSTQKRENNA